MTTPSNLTAPVPEDEPNDTRIRLDEERDEATWKQWFVDAKDQTLDTLPEFMRHITRDYRHDYGTVCHALAACAVAATWAAEKGQGITGFQAGFIFWDFYRHWMQEDGPARMLKYEDMLYPQYERRFRTIGAETWEWLQAEAATKLAEADSEFVHPNVLTHWQSIVDGNVPFGYLVEVES